jgi:hypothetical protein
MVKKGIYQGVSKKQPLGSLIKSGLQGAYPSFGTLKPLEMRKFYADPTHVAKAVNHRFQIPP